jgi:uncharacterized membrane protein YgcG
MKCPRCVQRIHRAAASCPHCGFTLADADARFGADPIRLRSLTDNAGILRRGDRQRIEAAMEKITLRFPQIFVAIYTGSFGELADIRQFGFWLLNRGIFDDAPVQKRNEAGILVTIDPESKAAGMVFGYLLDPFLEESDTFECLSRGHAYWLEEHYAEGILRTLKHLDKILRKRSRQARRDPKLFERKALLPVKTGDLVSHIRAGQCSMIGEEIREISR